MNKFDSIFIGEVSDSFFYCPDTEKYPNMRKYIYHFYIKKFENRRIGSVSYEINYQERVVKITVSYVFIEEVKSLLRSRKIKNIG